MEQMGEVLRKEMMHHIDRIALPMQSATVDHITPCDEGKRRTGFEFAGQVAPRRERSHSIIFENTKLNVKRSAMINSSLNVWKPNCEWEESIIYNLVTISIVTGQERMS